MKRTISVLGCVLFALIVLLPLGTLLSACFGYVFALAGVSVYAMITASISVCLVVLSKKPQRVYHGEWGEFENMDIYWKDDNCLVIHSVIYEIE